MPEKYINLYEAITDYLDKNDKWDWSCETTLNWLDEHPDQVPGRTITRSKYRDTLNGAVLVSGYGDDWERGFSTGLVVGGTKVAPDPEPTNAELIDEAYEVWDRDPQDFTFGEYLVRLGWTKAPGGDDE